MHISLYQSVVDALQSLPSCDCAGRSLTALSVPSTMPHSWLSVAREPSSTGQNMVWFDDRLEPAVGHVFPPAVSGGYTPHRQMSVSRSHQQTHRRVTNHAVYFQHCSSTLSRWLCYSIGAWSQFHRTANATPQRTATHTAKTQQGLTTETAKTQQGLTTETAKTQRRLTTQTVKTQRTISMTLASHDHTLSNNPAFPTHQ